PYGSRSIPEVRRYALACLDALVDMGVKALVIACNTASAAMLDEALDRYGLPVAEVILPAVRRAVRVSSGQRLAVLCTEATATSHAYDDALVNANCSLLTVACPRFVEFVENGVTSGDELLAVAEEYLAPVRQSGVDTVILGCTHYPLLSGVISYVLGPDINLVSSSAECANSTYAMLTKGGLLRPGGVGQRRFLTTGNPERFQALGARLLGQLANPAGPLANSSYEQVKVQA
ncbi:MAG: glutamate racemase, partial [Propionibacteriaceae bacterium]|nr:glutamate racemase [Propionibacteriaceae bacterium]